MRLRINSQTNGFDNGVILARDILGELAAESTFGNFMRAVSWIKEAWKAVPYEEKWGTRLGSCQTMPIENCGEKQLRFNVLDKYGFVVASIVASRHLCDIELSPSTNEGEIILQNINIIGATVKFGAAA